MSSVEVELCGGPADGLRLSVSSSPMPDKIILPIQGVAVDCESCWTCHPTFDRLSYIRQPNDELRYVYEGVSLIKIDSPSGLG